MDSGGRLTELRFLTTTCACFGNISQVGIGLLAVSIGQQNELQWVPKIPSTAVVGGSFKSSPTRRVARTITKIPPPADRSAEPSLSHPGRLVSPILIYSKVVAKNPPMS